MNQSELYNEKLIEGLLNGRASILVGAGFSLNALRANESVKKDLPLWNGLIDAMYEKLDLAKEGKEYLNPLSVAQQFEEMYGRPALNKYIKDIMKDDDYIPSKVHKIFLGLPWKNIFTTNYDTLLERTCKKIINRKYNIISREDDLLYVDGNPKIVKLHGTFPLYDSLIITEEDYRTYPKKHARFVNTVQQALLEDMFCVIGFSGSDPNFLNWIGWIHDNIGLENSPIIYMITDQKKSEAETKSLAAKNIQLIVIDDILKDNESTSPNKKYELYISNLKEQLEKRKKQSIVWLTPNDIKYENYKSENEKQLLDYLRGIHERYLGWIIAPYDYAQTARFILSETDQYYINKDEKKHQIEITYEYCWLHDICCIPLESFYVKKIEDLINQSDKKEKLDENKKYMIQYILVNLLRFYRFNDNEYEWNKIHEILKNNVVSTVKNKFIYEEIMNDIYHLNADNALNRIDNMEIKENESTWALRKASLLAMLGLLSESKQLLEKHLFNVRYSLSRQTNIHDFHNLSLEGCMSSLYDYVSYSKLSDNDELEELFDKNPKYDFIWKNENQNIILKIKKENDNEKKDNEQRTQSDFDRVFTSIPIIKIFFREEYAMNFLAFREAIGIPFAVNNDKFNTGLVDAAYLMTSISPKIPLVLAVLSNEKEIIDRVYTRFYISKIKREDIDELVEKSISHFNEAIVLLEKSRNTKNVIYNGVLNIIPEFISRFSVKCSQEKYDLILQMTKDLYKHNYSIIFDYEKCVTRIFNTTPLSILYNNIVDFLELDDEKMMDDLDYFALFYDRLNEYVKFEPKEEMHSKLKDQFKQYIDKVNALNKNDKHEKNRRFYINRLLYISKIYLLSNGEKEKLANVLIDPNNLKNEIPYTGDFSLFTLNDIISDKKYFNIQWKTIIEDIKNYTENYTITRYLADALNEGILLLEKEVLVLNEQEINELILVIKNTCDKRIKEKTQFSHNKGFMEINDNDLMHAGFLLARAIDKSETDVSKNKDVNEILSKLKDNKIPCAYLEYALNNRIPFEEFNYVRVNFNDNSFNESMIAISYLIKEGKIGIVNDKLIEELISSINKVDDLQVEQILKSLNELASYHKISETVLNNLSDKLTFVYEVTDYSKATDDSIVQKMFVRQALTSLLYTLKENYPNFKIDIKPYSNTNEFAEVRNAWYDRDFIKSLNPIKQSDDNEE